MARANRAGKHVEVLAERVCGLDGVFSCGGTVTLAAPVELRFAKRRCVRIVTERYGDDGKVVRRLKKACAPAPFGVGSETRRDSKVRDGGQLLAGGGALSVAGLDLAQTGILEEVGRVLCAGSAAVPAAELHALNVYERGGHFVHHKDTPRDRACFGTLVVCLPIQFNGGELVLRKESTRIFDWGSRYSSWGSREPRYVLKWAAFYGDVDHAIEPVTSGARVTLTWLLRSAEDEGVTPPPPAATEIDLEGALRDALADATFLTRGGMLGVPCTHLYAETAGFVRPAKKLSDSAASRLKGRDRRVAFAAMRAGLKVRYRPYLHEDCAYEAWRLTRAPNERELRIFRKHQLGHFELSRTMPIEREIGWRDKDDVTWIVPTPFDGDGESEIACAEASVPACDFVGALEYSATNYFGNEGGDAAFYVSAALLIDVPSARERGATPPKRRARRS